MKESVAVGPVWLERARAAWRSSSSSAPSRKWTAYWIKKFVVYLERRNKGRLPNRTPSWAAVYSFCRFIDEKWECEEWQVDEARVSLEWFASMAEFGGSGREVQKRADEDEGGGGG